MKKRDITRDIQDTDVEFGDLDIDDAELVTLEESPIIKDRPANTSTESMPAIEDSLAYSQESEDRPDDSMDHELEPVDDMWDEFLANLDGNRPKTKQVCCFIDSELAYTLDECKVIGAFRSEMVNAILRVFLKKYLNRFAEYQTKRKTLLSSQN